jgi:predicted nuclease of predicted toxin-antitoxin system
MSIPLYMDVNFAFPITEQLRLRAVDAITAQEDGAATLSDPALLDRAADLARIFVTHDKDFLAEASLRQQTDRPFLGVIYVPQVGLTIGSCVKDLELLALDTELTEWNSRVNTCR